MRTKHLWLLAGLLLTGIFVGCSAASGPEEQSDELTRFDLSAELSTLESGGVDFANTKGIFSLEWRRPAGPNAPSDAIVGQAFAVGFESATSESMRRRRGGVDIGSVFVNYAGEQVELKKESTPQGGIVYTLLTRPLDRTQTGLAFVGDTPYEFEVTGSALFSPLSIAVSTPALLLTITSHTIGQKVGVEKDLTIEWSGGREGRVAIFVAPVRQHHKRGSAGGPHRDPQGIQVGQPRRIVLDANEGSFTIPASRLQEFVRVTEADGIAIAIHQHTVVSADHDGGIVRAVLRDGDQIALRLE